MPRVVTPLSGPFRTPAAGTGAACAGAAWAAVGIAVAGVVLVAGCSGQSASSRGTVSTCYGFAVQALDRHATVTSVPPACTGLNHEQINLAVDRAIRAVVGPHRKVVARRLAHREAAYLAYLVTVVPPRAPVPPVTAPSRPSSRLPLDLAALAAWAVTVAAGARLLAGWIASGGLRRRYTRVAGVPRAVIVGHFTLALTGLGIWIGFLATGLPGLAWAGVAAVLSVAGLGMATLAGGLPQAHRPPGWAWPPAAACHKPTRPPGLAAILRRPRRWARPSRLNPPEPRLGRPGRPQSKCRRGNPWPSSRCTACSRRRPSCSWCSPRSVPADACARSPGPARGRTGAGITPTAEPGGMRQPSAHAGVVAGEFRGEVASFYARYRRGYPGAFTSMLARALRLGPDAVVADIGCGTGQLTIPSPGRPAPWQAWTPNRTCSHWPPTPPPPRR